MSRVVVAMSGGVDSSVAAALTVEAGHEVLGVTLRLLPKLESGFGCCGSPRDIDDAKRVCERLGIPHYTLDLAELFERTVVAPFVEEYLSSRTPNPCVECNRSVKFGYFHRLAEAWGADAVATGHYARTRGGRLLRAVDEAKDQTYFLHALTAAELVKVMFPVGELTKAEVRAKARALGLATAEKPESQEVCFVPGGDYRTLLRERAPERASVPGPIVDRSGRVVGEHGGLASYTVGQRRGLGLGGGGSAVFVTALEPSTNTLVVGSGEDACSGGLETGPVVWTAGAPGGAFEAAVRIRHRHAPAEALVTPLPGGGVRVGFRAPQRAVTPGQSAVFYRGDEVLGGAPILRALPAPQREVRPS